MPVYGIVANVGFTADKPPRERRPAEVAHLIDRVFPVDGFGLFDPKAVTIGQGTFAEFLCSKTGAHFGGMREDTGARSWNLGEACRRVGGGGGPFVVGLVC